MVLVVNLQIRHIILLLQIERELLVVHLVGLLSFPFAADGDVQRPKLDEMRYVSKPV